MRVQNGKMISFDEAALRLKGAGSRMTAQRRAVLDFLEDNRTHPTAEDIVAHVQAKLGDVSPATIYNTLESLEELGLLRRIDGLEVRAHFDPDTSPHEHAICRACRKVFDVQVERLDVPHFNVEDVTIRGLCEKCAETVSVKPNHKEEIPE